MLKNNIYDRIKAVEYANEYALGRNNDYLDFEKLGGDCTNFCSQCIYAGCGIMNHIPISGWYYNNSYDRSPSWTAVDFLYEFLVKNRNQGPFGIEVDEEEVQAGDIIQLGNQENHFYHSVFVSKVEDEKIYICTHSIDSLNRPLSSYHAPQARYIHISGVRAS